jgi:glycosidase
MNEFEELVERTHRAGLKVIIDFVPNHVARSYHSNAKLAFVPNLGQHDDTFAAFRPNNNFYYLPGQSLTLAFGPQGAKFPYSEFPARATGNDRFTTHLNESDWYDTVKLNYGIDYLNHGTTHFYPIPDTWQKMLDILIFWRRKGVDGFRCDMVEMVPVEFWQWVIPRVKDVGKTDFIAEIYQPERYRDYLQRGQFDYLYDKVGLYDTLRNVICQRAPATHISRCWQDVEGIQSHMLYFLENHDEQRIPSTFFAGDARAGLPGMIVAATMNTNPVMVYAGQELGEAGMDSEGFSGLDGRTTIFDYWSIASLRGWLRGNLSDEQKALREVYTKLLHIALEEPAIYEGAFYDLMYANVNHGDFNSDRVFAYIRYRGHEVILIAVNFSPVQQMTSIHIPPEVFHTLQIPDNHPAQWTDLMTGQKSVGTLTAMCPYRLEIPPYTGKLLKFNYNNV